MKKIVIEEIKPFLKLATESAKTIPLYNTQAELQLLSKLKNQSYKAYIGALKQLPTRDISTDLVTTSNFEIIREDYEILAGGLIPTQREIYLDATLPKTTIDTVKACFKDPVELANIPIITFNYTFIIDGHHRWSSICAINPRAKCKVINFRDYNLTPIQFLKLLQGAIVMEEGELPTVPKDTYKIDIFHSSNKSIKEYVEKNLSIELLQEIKSQLNLNDIEAARNYYIQNIISIKYNNIPAVGSPTRELMPQTNETEEALDIVKDSTPVIESLNKSKFKVEKID